MMISTRRPVDRSWKPVMRYLVLTTRKEGALRGLTAREVLAYFERVQSYYDGLSREGLLIEEGRLMGSHGRFQVYDVDSLEQLEEILDAAPNADCMDRAIHQIASVHETLDLLRSSFGDR